MTMEIAGLVDILIYVENSRQSFKADVLAIVKIPSAIHPEKIFLQPLPLYTEIANGATV